MRENENEKWRKWLTPLIGGLLSLMTAASMYLTQANKKEANGARLSMESRMAVVESKVEGIQDLRTEVRELTKSVNQLIGAIEYNGGRR